MKLKKNELKKWRENYTPWGEHRVVTEGLELNVHFDEKNWVKDLGAKWHPDSSGKGGYWWMPVRQLSRRVDSNTPSVVNIFEAGESDTGGTTNGITVLAWLDDNKMINCAYGDVDIEMVQEECKNLTSDGNDVVSEYNMANGVNTIKIEWWHTLGCVRFTSDTKLCNILPSCDTSQCWDERTMWENSLKAKDVWEELINVGFNVTTHHSARSKAITSP